MAFGIRLLLQRRRSIALKSPDDDTSSARAFLEGMIANLTNPNVLLFMLAFLPQFVDPAAGAVGFQMLLLGAIQKATGLLVLGTTALLAGSVGDYLAQRPGLLTWQRRFAGCALIALGLSAVIAGSGRPVR